MQLLSLNISKPITVNHQGRPVETGIFKNPVNQTLYLSHTQLDGDGQADLINHGGVDKAVCAYCAEHYAYWEEKLQRKLPFGAFGENFTIAGLTETTIHIGDVYEIGTAIVQVSQPRQPCFKLALKHQVSDLVLQVQETGYTGYYFRVLKEGLVASGQMFRLQTNHPLAITVAETNLLKYVDKSNTEAIRHLLTVNELAESWRESFQKRLDQASL
ncbi:MOSC domain-containing protein [Paenibacillus agricola]|uniref:MOSC domain-containing protein n=1 Tax=Paenibacillus agricola TaxID=2716264 RepID=A0ABX0JI14_9BACL|nr:MOSC domain-containing protein [Paenibacillus agricola]NHN34587.1 MOSC domain-containing protein [Paenibacillus agricola]